MRIMISFFLLSLPSNLNRKPYRSSKAGFPVKTKKMIMNDRRITVTEIADDVGISVGLSYEMFWRWNGFFITHVVT